MTKVFCIKDLQNLPGFTQVKKDFLDYMSCDRSCAPSYFGKDVPYDKPKDAVLNDLWHMHLAHTPEDSRIERPIVPWNHSQPQIRRTSNKFLVYTRGEKDRDVYIILAIIFPRAHEKSQSIDHMNGLIKLAEQAKAHY